MNTPTSPSSPSDSPLSPNTQELPNNNNNNIYHLFAPGEEFNLTLTPHNLPKTVSGQPASYFWKDVIAAGNYLHPAHKFTLAVDSHRLIRWAETGRNMIAAGVAIPINCDHSQSARDCVGYIKDFKVDGSRLLALCQLIGEDAPLLAARNQVSAGIMADFSDGNGRHWPDAIVHVALTPVPVVTGQDDFIAAPDSPLADLFLLANIEPAETPLIFPCDSKSLDTLRQAIPGLIDIPPEKIFEYIATHLQTLQEREVTQLSVISPTEIPPAPLPAPEIDPHAVSALRELFDTKMEIAFTRGAIDAHTRDRLSELLAQHAGAATLLLSRSAGKSLPLALAEILIENNPLPTGEATPMQTIHRLAPGEIDSSPLHELNKSMMQIANRGR